MVVVASTPPQTDGGGEQFHTTPPKKRVARFSRASRRSQTEQLLERLDHDAAQAEKKRKAGLAAKLAGGKQAHGTQDGFATVTMPLKASRGASSRRERARGTSSGVGVSQHSESSPPRAPLSRSEGDVNGKPATGTITLRVKLYDPRPGAVGGGAGVGLAVLAAGGDVVMQSAGESAARAGDDEAALSLALPPAGAPLESFEYKAEVLCAMMDVDGDGKVSRHELQARRVMSSCMKCYVAPPNAGKGEHTQQPPRAAGGVVVRRADGGGGGGGVASAGRRRGVACAVVWTHRAPVGVQTPRRRSRNRRSSTEPNKHSPRSCVVVGSASPH